MLIYAKIIKKMKKNFKFYVNLCKNYKNIEKKIKSIVQNLTQIND